MSRTLSVYKADGTLQEVTLSASLYTEAHAANLTPAQLINQQYPTDEAKYGSAYQQILAATGLVVPSEETRHVYGLRAPSMADVLAGGAKLMGAANTQQAGGAFGTQSRILFPTAIVSYMEASLVKDYNTDAIQFDKLIALNQSIQGDKFEQPMVNYNTPGGPHQARAQRRAQLAPPAAMMTFTTSDVSRRIPTYALGMEFSKEALKATTLDLVGLSMRRQMNVERDAWVNVYLSNVFNGDNDLNILSLAALGIGTTTNALDTAATGGVITQKSWLKWLWRNRKFRKIDWIVTTLDTYLKIEARTGRPSLTAIDTLLPRLEAQATIANNVLGDVKVFIVDDAADGGPLPANTILGLDSRYALARVRNTLADVTAAEQYALRQAEAFSIQFGEDVYRLHSDAMDVLTVTS